MDPVTHAVLGATVAQAGYRRRLGRRALAIAAAAAMLPDADIVVGWLAGPFANWQHHRGLTHSVFFAAIAGPLLGWLAGLADRERRRLWMGLFTAVFLTHPLIDVVTHYGTQLLAPLTATRFAIPAMPIIDPVFTLMLAAPLLLGVFATRRVGMAVTAAWAALIAGYGYVLFAWSLNQQAEAEARRQLAAAGVAAEVRAYPTVLQPYLRRVVATTGDAVLVGFTSTLAPRPIAWTRARPADGPAVQAAAATEEGRIFTWFTGNQVFWRVEHSRVVGTDLRYGYPGGSELGQWGIAAELDGDGRLAAPPHIISNRPGISGDNIRRLWGWVWGEA